MNRSPEQQISGLPESDECHQGREHLAEFVIPEEVKSFEDFLEKSPMFWMPEKKEIARLLQVALENHLTKVEKGEKNPDDPITIVDIGGSNGFLGRLVTDLAKDNNLNIRYTIVDPDKQTVEKAKQAYKNNPNLSFVTETVQEFILEKYKKDQKIIQLSEEQRQLIEKWAKKLDNLSTIVESIKELIKDNKIIPEQFDGFIGKVRKELEHTLPEGILERARKDFDSFDKEDFIKRFEKHGYFSEYFTLGQELEKIWAKIKQQYDQITKKIEQRLLLGSPDYDLVINSWMPPGTDLTPEIQKVNGASVIYILESWGATGNLMQTEEEFTPLPEYPWEGHSYNTGEMYELSKGWKGPSLVEIRNVTEKNGYLPSSKIIVVQKRKNSPASERKIAIQVEGKYPWEDKLEKNHGSLSEVTLFKPDEIDFRKILLEEEIRESKIFDDD